MGDSIGCLLRRTSRGRVRRDDDLNLKSDQFGRLICEPLDPAICCSVLNKDVLAFHIAEFTRSLPEGIDHHQGHSGTSSDPVARKPIRGTFFGCCARPATGHTAAPPRVAMNSRRLMHPSQKEPQATIFRHSA